MVVLGTTPFPPISVAGGCKWGLTSSCTHRAAFPQAAQMRAQGKGEMSACALGKLGCNAPPSLHSPKHQLPSQGLLSCWCAVSHVSDVTSPRHWSLEMDLMSLCFLQLRKTSKKLMLKHPEEPAGFSAAATVPAGGQRAAQCSNADWSAWKAEHQTSRGQHITGMGGCLSTLHPSTYHPPHGTGQVMSCNASQRPGKEDSTVVASCPHSEDPAASLRASTQEAEVVAIAAHVLPFPDTRAGSIPTNIYLRPPSSFCNTSHIEDVNPDSQQHRLKCEPVVFSEEQILVKQKGTKFIIKIKGNEEHLFSFMKVTKKGSPTWGL